MSIKSAKKKLRFVAGDIEVTTGQGELIVSGMFDLHELLNDVSDDELLSIMDINSIRAWLAAQDGAA